MSPAIKKILKPPYHACRALCQKIILISKKLILQHKRNTQKNKTISDIVQKHKSYTLFITHHLGGGTQQYVENYLNDKKNVLLLYNISYYNVDLCYCIKNVASREQALIKPEAFFLHDLKLAAIRINSLVSFSSIDMLLQKICAYKKKYSNCITECCIHDFHALCPNINLLANNTFCNLECTAHSCTFQENISIGDWRTTWGTLFSCIDVIICFSTSSKELFLRAYPSIPQDKVAVVPHDMSFSHFTPIKGLEMLPLHVGFIGAVANIHKGRTVVQHLLNALNESIPVSFIGAVKKDFKTSRNRVTFTGFYEHDNLQRIIEKEQITLVVFPSICPETFSYVISELQQMELPIICLNVGAQAEKVRVYHKGIVCNNMQEIAEIINAMEEKNS
ncbi:MAG: glycosyltransferase family 4 protein [Treponema sp.]|nr:glycosyltransferase family 4 protein [Treponema sp.]